MPAKQKSAVGMYDYRALIVGVQIATGAVKRVWVRNDGGMTDGGPIHYPAAGRTAAGEAIIVFGLTNFRGFPAEDLVAARALLRKACRIPLVG
jgi:hypothetical protein